MVATGLLAALCTLALALLAGPGDARGAFPGRPGLIAYDTSQQSGGAQSEENCGSESDSIATMRSDGSDRHRLGRGVDPAYSPDGQWIAYSICDGIQSDLWMMRSDGSDAHAVTETKGVSEEEPAFGPDGSTLYFSRDSGGEGYSDIYSIGIDGTGLKKLALHAHESSLNSPQAAANGRYVVYDREGMLVTMRPNGTHRRTLTPGWDPTISPNSHRIVYTWRGQLQSIGPEGKHYHQLTHIKSTREAGSTALSAAFSPDGRWVAFALERSVDYGPGFSDAQKLMKVSLATGKTVTLTKTSVGGFHPDWQPLP